MFLIRGKFQKKGKWIVFNTAIEENDEKKAVEKLYSVMGGNHGIRRGKILIEEVKRVGKGG